MTLCADCTYDRCPVADRSNVTACIEYSPAAWPKPRGTTHGMLMQMHHAAETGVAMFAAPTESVDPDHYKAGEIECVDAIRAMLGQEGFIAYCRGTIVKYNWRLGLKDDPLVEAGKAAVYQQWIKDTLDGKPLTKGKK